MKAEAARRLALEAVSLVLVEVERRVREEIGNSHPFRLRTFGALRAGALQDAREGLYAWEYAKDAGKDVAVVRAAFQVTVAGVVALVSFACDPGIVRE